MYDKIHYKLKKIIIKKKVHSKKKNKNKKIEIYYFAHVTIRL